MPLQPRFLSLVTTRRCTAACEHCCVGAGPRETDAIPIARLFGLIDEASHVSSIELVGFTGGECFLLGQDLDRLVEHASGRGFRTRVITNGYWALDERTAAARVAKLRARGLDEMMISTGSFHQRFVPVARAVRAARAAAEANIQTRLSVETCDQSSTDSTAIRAELRAHIESKRVVVSDDPWLTDAAGRGTERITHERLFAKEPVRASGRCGQILNVVSVTPKQRLVACCGFPLEQLEGLDLGSVAEHRLDEVLGTAEPDLLKLWLHVEGPAGIARFVSRYLPNYSLPPVASICEACVTLQRDRAAMQVLADHAREGFEALAARLVVTGASIPTVSSV